MTKIYKYASIDSGLLILKNKNVVVSDPTTFNDPFDSEFLVKSCDLQFGLRTYVGFLLENEILERCKKVIDSGNVKQKGLCQRFINRINRRRIRGVKRGYYYPLITLNYIELMAKVFGFTITEDKKADALESFAIIKNAIGNEGVVKLKEIISDIPRTLRVSCFSKSPDITKMWAHYANKHNGICLEYDEVKNVYPISYIAKEKYVKFHKFVGRYLSTICSLSNKLLEKEFSALFPILNKSKDWKEEQEIRMITSSNDSSITHEIVNGNSLDLYPIGKPSKVFIGVNVDETKKNEVISICEKEHIPFVICKKRNYKIIVEDH